MPKYPIGGKTSFKNKKLNKLTRIREKAPNIAIVLPTGIVVKTYNCPNVATVLINIYPRNHQVRNAEMVKPYLCIPLFAKISPNVNRSCDITKTIIGFIRIY